jgi:hypothetical protein
MGESSLLNEISDEADGIAFRYHIRERSFRLRYTSNPPDATRRR